MFKIERKKIARIQVANLAGLFAVVAGIAVSLFMNFAGRSLWLDEASLAQSLSVRGFWNLTSKPLANMQAAPILYIRAVKIIIHFFGNSEFTLRIFSVFCFAAVLFLVAFISKNVLKMKFFMLPAAYVANMNFLLRYSNEFKQYMCEAACGLFAIALFAWYSKHRDEKKAFFATSIIFAFLLWAANPACFVIGGLLAVEFACAVAKKDKKRALQCAGICGALCLSFLANYFYWLKDGNSEGMQNYWKNYAFSFFPFSAEKFSHNNELLLRVFNSMTFFKKKFKFFVINSIVVLSFASLAFACKEKNKTILSIFCALFLALFACSIHMFPMENRIWCFCYPLFGILIFYALDRMIFKSAGLVQKKFNLKKEKTIFCANAIFFVAAALLFFTNNGIKTYSKKAAVFRSGEETNDLISYVEKNVFHSEKVFVYFSSRAQTKYKIGYNTNKIGNVPNDNIIWSAGSAQNEKNLQKDFERISKTNGCWIITSHAFWEKHWKPLFDKLKEAGSFSEIYRAHGTRLYYYGKNIKRRNIVFENMPKGTFNSLSAQELWELVDKNTDNSANCVCVLKGKSGDEDSWKNFKNVWGLYTCYKQNPMDSKWPLKGSATVLAQNGDLYTLTFTSKTKEYKDVTVNIKRYEKVQ